MAGKKRKPRKTAGKPNINNLKPSNVLCPICRTILIEPVTLPCNHAFCKLCFEGTMENANLVCPLCRIRVSSWYRKAKKEDKLVDEKLWEAIQEQYSSEVQNKYQGIDNVMEADVPVIVVATPGEIRKEYEEQRQKELEEQRKIREAEEQASAPLIKKLTEEEENRRKAEEEKLRLDAVLARKLAEDLEKPSTSKFTPKKITKNDSCKTYGPMDRFIKSGNKHSKPHRLSMSKSQERKKIFKGERKPISITPDPTFATKEYTCHVLNAENRSLDENPFNTVDRPGYSKPSNSGGVPAVRKKIHQARKIIQSEERKSLCRSGYKSSGSGSDDAIDQECKFYFKPIDTQKKHHLPGSMPVKVPTLRRRRLSNVYIEPPTGKIINLQLRSVISAFARFSVDPRQNPPSPGTPSREVIEDESSSNLSSFKRSKRKILDDDSPVKKKERRQIYSKKNVQFVVKSKTISSPFYGFDNRSGGRATSPPPLHGFDALAIKESDQARDAVKLLLGKQESRVIDSDSVISTEKLYRNFKTYSRHPNRPSKGSQGMSDAGMKPPEDPLKLRISRTPKNGINISEVIRNKLAELRGSLDNSSETSSRKENPYKTNIDINRNVAILNRQPRPSNHLKHAKRNIDSDVGSQNVLNSATKSSTNSNTTVKPVNIVNFNSKSIDSNSENKRLRSGTSNKFTSMSSPRKARNSGVVGTESKIASTSLELEDTTHGDTSLRLSDNSCSNTTLDTPSPLLSNGLTNSWRTRLRHGSPRKVTTNRLNSKYNGSSPILNDDIASKTSRLEDTLANSVSKTYQAPNDSHKLRNPACLDTNSKITDTFSKVKGSPPKSRKFSPSKSKVNNNFELDLEFLRVSDDVHIEERQMQEESDFELAKKLQAEFDLIQISSRTRRGTKRQITLDEMLSS